MTRCIVSLVIRTTAMSRKSTPEGVSSQVAALVDKLFDRYRSVDDWVHAALTLPMTVETTEDRNYAMEALAARLDRIPLFAKENASKRKLNNTLGTMLLVAAVWLLALGFLPPIVGIESILFP